MAAVTDATYYTNQVGGTNGDTRVKTYPRAQNYRMVRIRRDLAGTESATDTFNLFKMKVAGTTLTIDIGDGTTGDLYANGVDLAAAAGISNFCDPVIPAGEDTPTAATSATSDVVVTIATSGTPAAASVVFYLAIVDEYSEQ
jgi:hypothetical protein